MKSVAINGFFDLIHKGHIIMIKEASELGELTVILNNDAQAMKKKGYCSLPQEDRRLIVQNINGVSQAIIVAENNNNLEAVINILKEINCDIFVTGKGDSPELVEACRNIGIEIYYFRKRLLADGSVCSSSKLAEYCNDNNSYPTSY